MSKKYYVFNTKYATAPIMMIEHNFEVINAQKELNVLCVGTENKCSKFFQQMFV